MKLSEIVQAPSSRESFNQTWLCEMPSGLGSFELYDMLEYSIKDFIKHGIKPEIHGKLCKIDARDKLFYWFGDENNIDLAIELHVKPEGLVVSATGKNPKLRSKAPYASDLYLAILKDSKKNVQIISDDQLSDEGLKLWQKLVSLGCKVSIYDRENPGKTFKSFEDPEQLKKYFKTDSADFRRYRYVLSEDVLSYCSMRASFKLREARENIPGMKLD